MYLPTNNITFDTITADYLTEKEITLSVMRLDKIHETVSGNKLFKLQFYVEKCLATTHKTIVTFGGAYSNHLAATAYLCKQYGIKCIGIVRGDALEKLTYTLETCLANGMQLDFVNAKTYKIIASLNIENYVTSKFGNCTIIPEGGFGYDGAKGASLIMDILKEKNPSHVCTCVGTATTLAGLLMQANTVEKIVAVPAIKNMLDIEDRLNEIGIEYDTEKLDVLPNYHFGGYAKHTTELIAFMNTFYTENKIPTDFVYTAKLMYGIIDSIKNDYFKKGSNIICLHTGGLQGNLSLPSGTLIYTDFI
jgi:1-aminocyclopropane-1-carboxylate deaminase